jgi:hypothetical protein
MHRVESREGRRVASREGCRARGLTGVTDIWGPDNSARGRLPTSGTGTPTL